MATLTPFDYHSLQDMADRNEYIVDGHGKSNEEEYERNRNRYIVDGHGASNRCAGHNCPADYDLATQEMIKARALYKHYVTHTKGTNDFKSDVELTQLVLSYTEEEKPTDDEMMEDAYHLIMNTDLKDFVCFYGIHKNTENYHVHISVGCYSKDGTKKLCMNNKKLYRYRAELDRIVAARNLSVIEPSKKMRWYEPEHAQWVDENREKLDVLPLRKEEGQQTKGQGKKKSNKQEYKEAKEQQEKQKRAIEEREKLAKMSDNLNYKCRYYVYQVRPEPMPVLMLKLALAMAGKYYPEPPYYRYKQNCENDSIYLGKVDYAVQRRMDAIAFARENGINTPTGFEEKRQEIGSRMNNLNKAKYQAEKRKERLQSAAEAYENYVNYGYAKDTGTYDLSGEQIVFEEEDAFVHEQYDFAELSLRALGYDMPDDIEKISDQLELTEQRIAILKEQIEEEKKKYRQVMKAIKSTEKDMQRIILDQYRAEEKQPVVQEIGQERAHLSIGELVSGAEKRTAKNEKYEPEHKEKDLSR